MPKVDMTATKDFTYMTRRLTANDPFQARNPLEARILERVRKVAVPAKPEAPDARVKEVVAPRILTTEEVLEAEAVERNPAQSFKIETPDPNSFRENNRKAVAKRKAKPGQKARKAKATK